MIIGEFISNNMATRLFEKMNMVDFGIISKGYGRKDEHPHAGID